MRFLNRLPSAVDLTATCPARFLNDLVYTAVGRADVGDVSIAAKTRKRVPVAVIRLFTRVPVVSLSCRCFLLADMAAPLQVLVRTPSPAELKLAAEAIKVVKGAPPVLVDYVAPSVKPAAEKSNEQKRPSSSKQQKRGDTKQPASPKAVEAVTKQQKRTENKRSTSSKAAAEAAIKQESSGMSTSAQPKVLIRKREQDEIEKERWRAGERQKDTQLLRRRRAREREERVLQQQQAVAAKRARAGTLLANRSVGAEPGIAYHQKRLALQSGSEVEQAIERLIAAVVLAVDGGDPPEKRGRSSAKSQNRAPKPRKKQIAPPPVPERAERSCADTIHCGHAQRHLPPSRPQRAAKSMAANLIAATNMVLNDW